MQQFDLAIIGSGVLGTFHAYHAVKKGLKVALIEKNQKPVDATVRNFGQVVPSGMNAKWQRYGRKSLEIYKTIQQEFDIKIAQHGSIYIASDEEELMLLEELTSNNKANGYASIMLTKEACLQKYPALQPTYCKAGLFFPEEVSADPRFLIHRLHQYLITIPNFSIHYQTLIKEIDSSGNSCKVFSNTGQVFEAEKVIVCSGSEFEILYPGLFFQSDLEHVKLQMLRLKSQPTLKIPGNILTGLTIRRYESFQECPSWQQVKANEEKESFWKRWGVHILFKQETDGTVILGDSHEYADVQFRNEIDFFIRQEVNDYFIKEAKKIMCLETWETESAWLGFYSQSKTQDMFHKIIDNKVHIVTGIGGKGMTGSAGFSFEHINNLYG